MNVKGHVENYHVAFLFAHKHLRKKRFLKALTNSLRWSTGNQPKRSVKITQNLGL